MTQILLAAQGADQILQWAPSTAYTAEEQVVYSGQLYARNTSGTSATTWAADASNWTLCGAGGGGGSLAIGDPVTGATAATLTAVDSSSPTPKLTSGPPSFNITNLGNAKIAMPAPTGVASEDTGYLNEIYEADAEIVFGPGTYQINESFGYYPGMFTGAGPNMTTIKVPTDLYSSGTTPAPFLYPHSGASFSTEGGVFTVRDIAFLGPGGGSIPGVPGNKSRCIVLAAECVLEHVSVQGFYSAGGFIADHSTLRHFNAQNNYIGWEFLENPSSVGGHNLDTANLGGNFLVGVRIAGTNAMDSCELRNVTVGFAPGGIVKTDDQGGWSSGLPTFNGTASTFSGITGCRIIGCFFEAVGNFAIADISTGSGAATFSGTTWYGTGHSWDSSYLLTTAPFSASYLQAEWAIYGRYSLPDTYFRGGEVDFSPGSVGIISMVGYSPTFEVNQPEGVQAAMLGSGSTWTNVYGDGGPVVTLNNGGTCYSYTAVGTIAVGDILEGTGTLGAQRASGNYPILGIAMTACSSGGAVVVQVPTGHACPSINLASGVTITNHTTPLYMDTTTPYHANTTPSTNQFVGVCTTGSSGGTVTNVLLRLVTAVVSGGGGGGGTPSTVGTTHGSGRGRGYPTVVISA